MDMDTIGLVFITWQEWILSIIYCSLFHKDTQPKHQFRPIDSHAEYINSWPKHSTRISQPSRYNLWARIDSQTETSETNHPYSSVYIDIPVMSQNSKRVE